MISGRLALGGVSLEFGAAKERFAEQSRELETLTGREALLLEKEKKVLADLARLYLPELSGETVSTGIAELGEEMARALAAQEQHRRDLEDRLAALPETIGRHELMLAEAERAEEMAARGVRTVRDAVEQELGKDSAHRSAVDEHRALMERRSILTARRLRLQTTSSVERSRYEDDEAFRYLQAREYGEPQYRRGFLSRKLDAWLARRIDYDRLLRNYLILNRGPQLMQLELRDLTQRARTLESAIDQQESEVGARLGLPSALSAGAAAQVGLREARVALTDVRSRHDRLAAEIRAVDANRGRPWEDALEKHQDFLATRDVSELVELARSTPDPKDDGLVSRLEEIREGLAEVGRGLRNARERMATMNNRVTGLGDLFRRATEHFSSRRSYFPEEANFAGLVAEVADGTADVDTAIQRLETVHVREPLLQPGSDGGFDGWFADLSARFDEELGAVEVRYEHRADIEGEVVVYDNHGRELHRRVSRPGQSWRT